ncbi:MAG: LytR/AlgR family response regulator transcription factor [Flavitalea sp.]
MTVLIIEDEFLVAESLIRLVKEIEPGATLFGPMASVKETKLWLQSHPQPDLILSDIQLADGISLDIFSGDKPECPIIFTTAYNEYAIRAFKVNSIDYLLKPIDRKELQLAFQKFHFLQSKFQNESYVRQMMEMFNDISKSRKYKERFAVHIGRSVGLVPVKDIAGFIKEEIIYLLNTEGKKMITDYRSLDEVEELVDPAIFYRANRQCLIQLGAIESYRTDHTSKLQLRLKSVKEEITISKEKAAEFRNWFDSV